MTSLCAYTQPACTHCATEHLAAGRIGHTLQLIVQHSWVQAYDIALDSEHSFFVAPLELWNKLTAKTVNAPSQAVPGGLTALKHKQAVYRARRF